MRETFFSVAGVLIISFALFISPLYAANITVGGDKIIGSSTTGIQFDANADGVADVTFKADGSIDSKSTDERMSGANGEYLDLNDQGDGNVCFGGNQGTVNKNLCFGVTPDLNIFSPQDDGISIYDNVQIWQKKAIATTLTVRSNGTEDAKLLFNEDAYTRGEILSHGDTNSFRINSLNAAGLFLNATNTFNVNIAAGGGKTAIGHSAPATTLDINGAMTIRKATAAPANPPEGAFVVWMSNGTGGGVNGDVMVKATSGGVTKTTTLVKF